jgi:hypothetical protein
MTNSVYFANELVETPEERVHTYKFLTFNRNRSVTSVTQTLSDIESAQGPSSFSAEQQRDVERIMASCLANNCWQELPKRIAAYCAKPENHAASAALTNYVFKG